jgi:hypothetical protein
VVVLGEAQLQRVVAAVEEVVVVVVAAAREEMERMVVQVLLHRVERVDQAFPSRFLVTIAEIPNHTVQVEMAEQTHSLVSPLEQAVRQIRVMEVEEDLQRPSSHPTLVA